MPDKLERSRDQRDAALAELDRDVMIFCKVEESDSNKGAQVSLDEDDMEHVPLLERQRLREKELRLQGRVGCCRRG